MQRPCATCGIILQTGEKVRMEIEAIYQEIPSQVAFCVRQNTVGYVVGTARHAKCPKEQE